MEKHMKKIIAKIDPKTGILSIETQGYKGQECYDATSELEKSLGMDRACAASTPEMYQQPEQQENKVSE